MQARKTQQADGNDHQGHHRLDHGQTPLMGLVYVHDEFPPCLTRPVIEIVIDLRCSVPRSSHSAKLPAFAGAKPRSSKVMAEPALLVRVLLTGSAS